MGITRTKSLYITFFILLLSGLVVALGGRSSTPTAQTEMPALPDTLGSWERQQDIEYEDRVLEILGTDNVLGRVYENSEGETLTLVLINALNNRSAFHPPEYCMTGMGAELIDKSARDIKIKNFKNGNIEVNEMLITSGEADKMLVWNFYAVEETIMTNFYKQQLKLFTHRLRSGNAAGSMVNIYIGIERENIEYARNLGRDFMTSFMPVFQKLYLQGKNYA